MEHRAKKEIQELHKIRNKAKEFITDKHAEYESPFKMRESINFYDTGDSRKLSVWRKVEKDLNATYEKKRKSGEFYLPKIVNCDTVFGTSASLADLVST